ncbi:hypothetical protein ACFVYG_42910 [Streptomyces sp. NPDC058256]|uniref:hypothetical protein n=1 Tax=Streptomyces sp. NPDC058256 TaxID=3346408 RepID=UPI0036E24ADF
MNCATAKAITSRHGTGPSATAWWAKAASTLPTSANVPARTQAPARLGRGPEPRLSSSVT